MGEWAKFNGQKVACAANVMRVRRSRWFRLTPIKSVQRSAVDRRGCSGRLADRDSDFTFGIESRLLQVGSTVKTINAVNNASSSCAISWSGAGLGSNPSSPASSTPRKSTFRTRIHGVFCDSSLRLNCIYSELTRPILPVFCPCF